MGKPATIFTVELPEFGFEFLYRQVIPIIGPLVGTFAGEVRGPLRPRVRLRHPGHQPVHRHREPAVPAQRVLPERRGPGDGGRPTEITFGAEIAVGAGAVAGRVATVGVEGGIAANIFFNLNDPDRDTKVRFAELASNIIANDGNPLAMFDVSGTIEFFLRAVHPGPVLRGQLRVHPASSCSSSTSRSSGPGVVASQQGGTLTLNIGAERGRPDPGRHQRHRRDDQRQDDRHRSRSWSGPTSST